MHRYIEMQVMEMLNLMAVKQPKGQGLIEYGLIVLLIIVGILVILGLVGGQVQDFFNQIFESLGDWL